MPKIKMTKQEKMEKFDIEGAKNGDRASIEFILSEFCNNPHKCNPEMREYVADRIRKWFELSCKELKEGAPLNPNLAGKAFNLVAPSHRPKLPKSEQRHIEGWKAYLLARNEGLGHNVSLEKGAKIACMSEESFCNTRKNFEEVARLLLRIGEPLKPESGIKIPKKFPRKSRPRKTK